MGLLLAGGLLVLSLAAEPVAFWTFDDPAEVWRPRGEGIQCEVLTPDGSETGPVLHLSGRIEPGWNYALTDPRAISPGGLMRLSCRIKVLSLGPDTPAPYLKAELMPEDGRTSVAQIHTDAYDLTKLGTWQTISGEFQVPETARRVWLAIEKGTNQPCQIDLLLDNVKLEPINVLSKLEKYRLDPLPKSLEAARGVHPRLFLNAANVAELKAAIGTTHQALWTELQALSDRYVKSGPPKYREKDSYSGDEQLWQREVGNAMPHIALCWLLTGDRKYADSARDWALASCGYPTWGLGRTDGMDLASGHQLLGLATVYDWCHDALDEQSLTTIRETLLKRAGHMFEQAAVGQAWWQQSYLQNHLWVNACGMAAAGLSIYDEQPDAVRWVGLALEKFQRTAEVLGPDGASHEGVGYWQYGAEYLMKFNTLAEQLLGVDLWGNPWWRHTAAYAQYLTLPRGAWTGRSSLVDIADCPRGNWYGPDYLLRGLATRFRDGHAQELAAAIDEANITSNGAMWLNLVWYDPTLQPTAPGDLPTLRHFEDMGLVSARNGWTGDDSLLVFKCGPFIGHAALNEFKRDPGGGHVHPDAAHFVLFGDGEWLLRDDGYRAKYTSQHNTLLIDGVGQYGEGRMWFDGGAALRAHSAPTIVAAESTPAVDRIVGDATQAYPPARGVKRFTREVLFIKPSTVVVVDDVELDQARPLELRFHPESPTVAEDGAFLASGKTANLRVELLTPDGVEQTVGELAAAGRHGDDGQPMLTIRFAKAAQRWHNVTALTWCAAGQTPARVKLVGDAVEVGGRRVPLDPQAKLPR